MESIVEIPSSRITGTGAEKATQGLKSPGYAFRGLRVESQHSLGGSQLSVTAAPGDPRPFSSLLGHCIHVVIRPNEGKTHIK